MSFLFCFVLLMTSIDLIIKLVTPVKSSWVVPARL